MNALFTVWLGTRLALPALETSAAVGQHGREVLVLVRPGHILSITARQHALQMRVHHNLHGFPNFHAVCGHLLRWLVALVHRSCLDRYVWAKLKEHDRLVDQWVGGVNVGCWGLVLCLKRINGSVLLGCER